MDKTLTWVLVILAILTVISAIGSLVLIGNQPKAIDTGKLASDVAAKIVVPAASAPVVNTTDVDAKLIAIETAVNKESNFKASVLDLATVEYSAKNNRDVYNAINAVCNYTIDSKNDISSITLTDSDVTNINVDKGRANVYQEIKVRYDDSNGDSRKCSLDINTVVKDNIVDDQTITLA